MDRFLLSDDHLEGLMYQKACIQNNDGVEYTYYIDKSGHIHGAGFSRNLIDTANQHTPGQGWQNSGGGNVNTVPDGYDEYRVLLGGYRVRIYCTRAGLQVLGGEV